ncbi:hypothetical protein [Herbidospora cretacea]|uniref:hypothetical protein n=1 Tax=Herbidospora cretacea TaxID=28444 RepID=UPI0007749D0B|nr:hypothetical protein [Herbidospora cretacea]
MRISEKPVRDAPRPVNGSPVDRPTLSGPASRKLPVPPRERKPALAAVAVLLIIGGALTSTLLVMRSGDRVSAVGVAEQIGAGQQIPVAALREVQIADTGISYVPWRSRDEVAKTFAAVTLLPGTLLTETMVTTDSEEVGPNRARVGLSLKAGQYPSGLKAGDVVQVIYVPANARGAVVPQKVLVPSARVHSAGSSERGASGLVTVIVDASLSPQVAAFASTGEIALAVLPGAR